MIIECENQSTRQITFEGERVNFSEQGTARVTKDLGEKMADKLQPISIKKRETKKDGDE